MNDYQRFLVRMLRHGVEEASALLATFTGEEIDRELRSGAWTVRRQAHHLRQVEGRYVERLEAVLAGSGHVPAPVQHRPPDESESVDAMIAGFRERGLRAAEIFEGLRPDQWGIVFNHPTLWGDVTVEWWAARFIQHTAEHLGELWMFRQLAGLSPEAYEARRVAPVPPA